MAKYTYPAILTHEASAGYSINFPDFESCYTSALNLEEGTEMARDVLRLTLCVMKGHYASFAIGYPCSICWPQ